MKTKIKELLSYQKEQIKNETYLIRNLKNKIKNDMKTNNISKNIEYNLNGNIKYYKTAHDLFLLRKNNQKRHYWYFMLKNIKTLKHQEKILNRINSIGAFYLNKKGATEYIYKTLLDIK